MDELRVGDSVVCISPNGHIDSGQRGVVVWVHGDLLMISTKEYKYLHSRFKKVREFKGNIK